MHSELKSIQDQKNLLERRLETMNKRVKKTKKVKNERTEPWNKNKFLLYNPNKKRMESTLVNQGIIRPSSKQKNFRHGRTYSGLKSGRNTWSRGGGLIYSGLSNGKKQRNGRKKHASIGFRSTSKKMGRKSSRKRNEEDFKVRGLRKESPSIVDAVKRHEFMNVPPQELSNDKRNKMIEREKMSKLFTRDRRQKAKNDFMDRAMFNVEKQKLNKKKLQEKYYNYDFKPQINKNRINIYKGNNHKNVYTKTIEKQKPTERNGMNKI